MKKIFLLSIIISVSGCGFLDTYRAGLGSNGANTADDLLYDSLWYICKAATIGSIKRRFDTLEELIQYNNMCKDQDELVIE